MSVPIHNLYDFIHQVTEKQYWTCFFYPPGEKSIDNLINLLPTLSEKDFEKNLKEYKDNYTINKLIPQEYLDIFKFNLHLFLTVLLCHDQEPLNYNLYSDDMIKKTQTYNTIKNNVYYNSVNREGNLRNIMPLSYRIHWILLHSELNSQEVIKYQKTGYYIPAYYWSHALLSRDWFRYAKYDPGLKKKKQSSKTFLIYCRETTGTRAYRKTFLDKIKHVNLSYITQSFDSQEISSDSSATYNVRDFVETDISVVLETIFDDRIHLTEKTLRPIACGHPFFILNGPGCIEYLKRYGFKTFDRWWDESYDQEQNSNRRMEKVIKSMSDFYSQPEQQKTKQLTEIQQVCEYNKKLFFSDVFFNNVVNELKLNIATAYESCDQTLNWKKMLQRRTIEKQLYPENCKSQWYKNKQRCMLSWMQHFRKGGNIDNYVPPDLD